MKKLFLTLIGLSFISCILPGCGDIDGLGKWEETVIKTPTVEHDSFNLTDKEFIDWMNSFEDFNVSYIELDISSNVNTAYTITMSDDETGVLILNHGNATENHNGDIKNQNVCGIMAAFDDMSSSLTIPIWIAAQIDSRFSINDAISEVVAGNTYSKANMSIVYLEDSEVALLAPSTYIASII